MYPALMARSEELAGEHALGAGVEAQDHGGSRSIRTMIVTLRAKHVRGHDESPADGDSPREVVDDLGTGGGDTCVAQAHNVIHRGQRRSRRPRAPEAGTWVADPVYTACSPEGQVMR